MSSSYPDSWAEVRLGDILTVIRNGTTATQVDRETDFPVSRIETIAEGTIDWSRVGYLAGPAQGYQLEPGDVLFSHINSLAHLGKVALFNETRVLYHGMNLMLLRFDSKRAMPSYCFRILQSPIGRSHARREAKSAINQASLGQAQIKDLRLHLPPLSEQRGIAVTLKTLDKVILCAEEIIAKLKLVQQGLSHDLLTRGIDEGGELRPSPAEAPGLYMDSRLGRIPRAWEVREVGELGLVSTGTTPSTMVSANYGGDELFVSPADIGNERWIEETQKTLTQRGLREARELPPYAVMVTCIGNLGRVGQSRRPVATNQQINTIIPSPGIDPVFLFHASALLRPQLEVVAGRQVVPIVNKGQFAFLRLPIPPLAEQKAIASVLEACEGRLEKEQRLERELRIVKRGLADDLLTGRVRLPVPEVANA
jgi:type I restriction enzyme S subunit